MSKYGPTKVMAGTMGVWVGVVEVFLPLYLAQCGM